MLQMAYLSPLVDEFSTPNNVIELVWESIGNMLAIITRANKSGCLFWWLASVLSGERKDSFHHLAKLEMSRLSLCVL